MLGNVLSLATIVEESAVKNDISNIFFIADPITLKIASQITLRRIRKRFVFSIEEFLDVWAEDPCKAIIILAPEVDEVSKVFTVIKELVHISLRNGNKAKIIPLMLLRNGDVMRSVMKLAVESGIDVVFPPDLNSLVMFLLRVANADEAGIIVCEPSLIEVEQVGESYDHKMLESLDKMSATTEIGKGRVAVLALGSMFRFLANLAIEQGIMDDVKLIGILRFGSSTGDIFASVLKKYKYLIVADPSRTMYSLLSSQAYYLLSRGEIGWIPEIIDLFEYLDSNRVIDFMGVTRILKSFLGRGVEEGLEDIKTRNEVAFLLSESAEGFVENIAKKFDLEVLYVKPFVPSRIRAKTVGLNGVVRCVLGSENILVVVHATYLIRFFDVFRLLLARKNKRSIIILADTTFVDWGLNQKVVNVLENLVGKFRGEVSVFSLREDSPDGIFSKLRKLRRIIVLT